MKDRVVEIRLTRRKLPLLVGGSLKQGRVSSESPKARSSMGPSVNDIFFGGNVDGGYTRTSKVHRGLRETLADKARDVVAVEIVFPNTIEVDGASRSGIVRVVMLYPF
jgi:hypothetical protein